MGDKIRFLRKQRGWTQRRLAEEAGLSYWWVNHIENETKEVGMSALRKIADALEVTINELFLPVDGKHNQKEEA